MYANYIMKKNSNKYIAFFDKKSQLIYINQLKWYRYQFLILQK
jgi:hypothetical protein